MKSMHSHRTNQSNKDSFIEIYQAHLIKAAKQDKLPIIIGGIMTLITWRYIIWGAIIPPILAMEEPIPTAVVLRGVGYNSAV